MKHNAHLLRAFACFVFMCSLALQASAQVNFMLRKATENEEARLMEALSGKYSNMAVVGALDRMLKYMNYETTDKKEDVLRSSEAYYDLQQACDFARTCLLRCEKTQREPEYKLFKGYFRKNYTSLFQEQIDNIESYLNLMPLAYNVDEFCKDASKKKDGVYYFKLFGNLRVSLAKQVHYQDYNSSSCRTADRAFYYGIAKLFGTQLVGNAFTTANMSKFSSYLCGQVDKLFDRWQALGYPFEAFVDSEIGDRNHFEYRSRIYSRSVLKLLSDRGYGYASYAVARLTFDRGKTTDPEAYSYYKKAVDQGFIQASMRLARCLAFGYGCKVDRKKAFDLIKGMTADPMFNSDGAFTYKYLCDVDHKGKMSKEEAYEVMSGYAQTKYGEDAKVARQRENELYEKYFK